MTLVVATAIAEGIVIGADSRTTVRDAQGGGQPRKGTDYANKLFDVRGFAIGTSGCASFLRRPIGDHMEDFERALPPNPSFDIVWARLGTYFAALYKTHVASIRATPIPSDPDEAARAKELIETAVANADIYFLIAGLDGGQGRIDRIFVTKPDAKLAPLGFQHQPQFEPGYGGVTFIGSSDVCERLIHGYSTTLLKTVGIPENLDKILRSTATNIPFNVWRLQDAFNMVWTLFYITMFMQQIQVSRPGFGMEHPNVGGEVDLVTITPKHGFEWRNRKATSFRETISAAPELGEDT